MNCSLSLADTTPEFQIHVSVRILTIKISQWARVNFCSYRRNSWACSKSTAISFQDQVAILFDLLVSTMSQHINRSGYSLSLSLRMFRNRNSAWTWVLIGSTSLPEQRLVVEPGERTIKRELGFSYSSSRIFCRVPIFFLFFMRVERLVTADRRRSREKIKAVMTHHRDNVKRHEVYPSPVWCHVNNPFLKEKKIS